MNPSQPFDCVTLGNKYLTSHFRCTVSSAQGRGPCSVISQSFLKSDFSYFNKSQLLFSPETCATNQ